MQENNLGVWSIARRARVSQIYIKRILEDFPYEPSYRNASMILEVVAPTDRVKLLTDLYSNFFPILSPPIKIQEVDNSLAYVLKSRIGYLVHSMASTTLGITRLDVDAFLGAAGIRALDDFLRKGILEESVEGGSVKKFV